MIMISVMGASYLGTVVYDMIENSEWMRPFLIFKYFPNDEVIRNLSLDPMYIGLCVFWILIGLALAFVRFPRRDLHI